MQPQVGQPVKYYPSESAEPQAGQIIAVLDQADGDGRTCVVSWCPVTKAWVERHDVWQNSHDSPEGHFWRDFADTGVDED